MDLETFRAIDVDIDLANDFVPDVILSANDYNGRCIVARVTNGGVSVSGDNLSARLLFNTAPGISAGGYVTMTRVASSPTATWQVPVPSDALVARQVMLCVQIVDSDDNLVCSRNFRGIVDRKLMDDDAPESVNELNRLWEGIDALENIDASVTADGTVSVTAPDGTVTTSTAVPTAVSAANSATSAANTAATAANTAATAASTAADDANAAAARAEEAAKPTEEMFASYHALLKAGASEGIASDANPVQSSFLNRASGSAEGVRDGIATIECVRGNTVGWNQTIHDTVTATNNGGIALVNDVTKVISGHKYLFAAKFEVTVDDSQVVDTGGISIALFGKTSSNVGVSPILRKSTSGTGYERVIFTSTYDGVSNGTNSNAQGNLWLYRYSDAAGYSGTISNFQLFDLTAMFGAGNEPATVEEFEALYPEPYYPYDPGTLKPVMFEGMETVGFNQWDEEWEAGNIGIDGSLVNNAKKVRSKNFIPVIPGNAYALECSVGNSVDVRYYDAAKNCLNTETSWWSKTSPKTFDSDVHYIKFIIGSDSVPVTSLNPGDICIHLKWSGYRDGEYEEYWKSQREIAIAQHFPDGMWAVPFDGDELRNDKAINRVHKITIDGTNIKVVGIITSGNNHRFQVAYPSGFNAKYAYVRQNCKANNINVSVNDVINYPSQATNDAIYAHSSAIYIISTPNGSNCSSIESMNAWLQSNPIEFAYLINDVETPIDPPLNLGYKVSDFGTERVMLADGVISAPPVFEIAYGYTAESLRDAAASIVAPVENHLAQDNYAIGSYLVRNGVLYKVTAAIARNEAIVPGTNVVATTVMAEIAAING